MGSSQPPESGSVDFWIGEKVLKRLFAKAWLVALFLSLKSHPWVRVWWALVGNHLQIFCLASPHSTKVQPMHRQGPPRWSQNRYTGSYVKQSLLSLRSCEYSFTLPVLSTDCSCSSLGLFPVTKPCSSLPLPLFLLQPATRQFCHGGNQQMHLLEKLCCFLLERVIPLWQGNGVFKGKISRFWWLLVPCLMEQKLTIQYGNK